MREDDEDYELYSLLDELSIYCQKNAINMTMDTNEIIGMMDDLKH